MNGAEDGTRRVRKRVGAAFGGVITGAAVVVVVAGVDVDAAASALSLGIGNGGDSHWDEETCGVKVARVDERQH